MSARGLAGPLTEGCRRGPNVFTPARGGYRRGVEGRGAGRGGDLSLSGRGLARAQRRGSTAVCRPRPESSAMQASKPGNARARSRRRAAFCYARARPRRAGRRTCAGRRSQATARWDTPGPQELEQPRQGPVTHTKRSHSPVDELYRPSSTQ